MIFIALYLLLDLVPAGDVIVGSMRYRFYGDVLNLAVAGYLLSNYGKMFAQAIPVFFRQVVPMLYGLFVLLSAASIAVATNRTEGWVDVASYLSNFVTFVHLFALLYAMRNNIRFVAILATGILFCEVGTELYSFFTNLGTKGISVLANAMKWNTGNKNIFAAGIIVKLVFVLYACFRTKGWLKIFSYGTLFLSVVAIFVLSARASYLSLIAIVLLVGIGQILLYRRDFPTDKKPLYHSLALFGIFLTGFLIANSVLTKHSPNLVVGDKPIAEGTSYVEARLGSVVDFENQSTNIRFALWRTALEKAREHPLLGIGAGNYRVHSPYLMAEYFRYDDYTKYVHNDFVQIAAESGFPAAIAYLLLFVFAFVLTVKIWIGPAYSREQKFTAILLLGGIIGFFVDSVFNFPITKINMNIPFLLTLSLLLTNSLNAKPTSENEPKTSATAWGRYAYIVLLVLFLGAVYVDHQVFDSGKAQYVIRGDSGDMDYGNPQVALTYREADKLLSARFPSIGNNSQPIVLQKAKYLFAEKEYEKALGMMGKVREQSPYSLHFEVFSKRLHAALHHTDSALYYSNILLEKRPYNTDDYFVTMELAKFLKDSQNVRTAYELHRPYLADAEKGYTDYIAAMLQAGYDYTDHLAELDEGVARYPENELLKKIRAHFALVKDVIDGRRHIPPDQLPRIVLKRNEAGETEILITD